MSVRMWGCGVRCGYESTWLRLCAYQFMDTFLSTYCVLNSVWLKTILEAIHAYISRNIQKYRLNGIALLCKSICWKNVSLILYQKSKTVHIFTVHLIAPSTSPIDPWITFIAASVQQKAWIKPHIYRTSLDDKGGYHSRNYMFDSHT